MRREDLIQLMSQTQPFSMQKGHGGGAKQELTNRPRFQQCCCKGMALCESQVQFCLCCWQLLPSGSYPEMVINSAWNGKMMQLLHPRNKNSKQHGYMEPIVVKRKRKYEMHSCLAESHSFLFISNLCTALNSTFKKA